MAKKMDDDNGRDERGRFKKGAWAGGPGRPSRAREESYLAELHVVCDAIAWRKICRRAVRDAAAGDRHAREWLTRYLVPTPIERHEIQRDTPISLIHIDDFYGLPEGDERGNKSD